MHHHHQPVFTAEPCPNRPAMPTAIIDDREKGSWGWLLPCLLMSWIVLLAGCAAPSVHTTGTAASVAWEAKDFKVDKTTVTFQPGERYSFTLRLHDTGGRGVTFTALQWTVSQHGVNPFSTGRAGQWRLRPNGELDVPFSFAWYCPQAFESCRGAAGPPQWHIIFTGADDRTRPVRLVINVAPPPV